MKFDLELNHILQRNIIKQLIRADQLRFSDIKPADIESNLFMYHLNQLIKEGFVEKVDGKYQLTQPGKMYVDRTNLESLQLRVQPKILSIIAVKRADGKWLILERLHQPHLNRKGLIAGKIHYGETLQEAAERELSEKANLTDIPLALRGNLTMRFFTDNNKNLMSHVIGYVFSAEVPANLTTTHRAPHWRTFWGDETDLRNPQAFQGHPEIFTLLKKRDTFIESFDFSVDE